MPLSSMSCATLLSMAYNFPRFVLWLLRSMLRLARDSSMEARRLSMSTDERGERASPWFMSSSGLRTWMLWSVLYLTEGA